MIFSIELVNIDGSAGDISTFSDVTVRAKSGCHYVDFSKSAKPGYLNLVEQDNTLRGIIPAADTAEMLGDLEFEVVTFDENEIPTPIQKENSGLKIVKRW